MPAGRPSKYKPEYCERLIAHMAEGYPFETFAADINVGRNTLYQWEKAHDKFRDAKSLGAAKSLKWWISMGRAGMAGKIKGFVPAVWIFSMKNHFGWGDKLEITGESDKPIVLKYKA